jgi:hypothetical protein
MTVFTCAKSLPERADMAEAAAVFGSMQRHQLERMAGARAAHAICLASLVSLGGCSREDVTSPSPEPVSPTPSTSPEPASAAMELDEDRIVKLYPDAPGTAFRLGDADLNGALGLTIEEGLQASRGQDGPIAFWTVPTYDFEYSEGNTTGKTARLHIGPPAEQRFDWRNQHGFLSSPEALGDQEFTAFVRVHGIFDRERAAFELKVRGGRHTEEEPALASCTMMTFATTDAPGVSRFGKELNHPEYDFVSLPLRYPAELDEDRWYGLKLVTFVDPERSDRVTYRLYVDDDPFLPDGSPRNAFRLLTEYVDRSGTSTGLYDTLVDWRGFVTTLRVDGVQSLDVARLSARGIHG